MEEIDLEKKYEGNLKKVENAQATCESPKHIPPFNDDLAPGLYEYTCPACGKLTKFTIPTIISS